MTQLVQEVKDDIRATDLIGVIINHPVLDTPIEITYSVPEKVTAGKIIARISAVAQSKKALTFGPDLEVIFSRIREQKGGRLPRR